MEFLKREVHPFRDGFKSGLGETPISRPQSISRLIKKNPSVIIAAAEPPQKKPNVIGSSIIQIKRRTARDVLSGTRQMMIKSGVVRNATMEN
jgi:hypothetical protein